MVQQYSQLPLLLRRYLPPRDLAGYRVGQLGEAHIVRQLEQRQSQPVCRLCKLCRQGVGQIAPRLDAHAGQPLLCRCWQQSADSLRVIRNGKTRGNQKLSLCEPTCVVRCIRQIDAADPMIQSCCAAANRAACECGQLQNFRQHGIVRRSLLRHGFSSFVIISQILQNSLCYFSNE